LIWLNIYLIQSDTKDISTILGLIVIIFTYYFLRIWRTGHRSPKYQLQPSLPSSRASEVSYPVRHHQPAECLISWIKSIELNLVVMISSLLTHFLHKALTSTTFWRVFMAFSRTDSTYCMIPSLHFVVWTYCNGNHVTIDFDHGDDFASCVFLSIGYLDISDL
jgi:hypothetical protein